MMKTTSYIQILAGIAAGGTAMYFLHPNISPFPPEESALIREVVETLEQKGLNHGTTEGKTYGIEAAAGLARHQDRWARLLNKEEAQRLAWVSRVGAGSTGIDWRTVNDRTFVTRVRPGSPAAQAGIATGDVLMNATGTHPFNASAPISALHQHPPGAAVTLRMWRDAEMTFKDYTLTLEKDPESSAQLVSHSTAASVIKIREFDGRLESQLFEIFKTHFSQVQPKSLVLDLRDQPGGQTDAARRLAAYFVKPGTALFQTKCSNGKESKFRAYPSAIMAKRKHDADFAPIADWLTKVPLTIQVNDGTYSAAELVTAALQEAGRATVEGVRTNGKGVGQEPFGISGGRQLWLTTCEYSRPSGRPLHRIGVVPDKYVDTGMR